MFSKLIENIIHILDYYHLNKLVHFYDNKEINIVIDIGSHKGEFLKKIRKIKPEKIYAFEPQINIFKALKENTKNYPEVRLFNVACDNKNSFRTLYINSLSLSSSLLKPNQEAVWVKFKKFILQTKNLIEKKIKII